MSLKSFLLSVKKDKNIMEKFYMWRYELWSKLPLSWRDFYYKVTGFCWHRYTTIKSRHLPHTWVDKDTILVFTTFEILEKFIEEECSPGIVEWYHDGNIVEYDGKKVYIMDLWKEILRWWNEEYIPFTDGKHPIEREYLDSIGICRLIEDEPDETYKNGSVIYNSIFRYESEEHKKKHEECKERFYKLEEEIEAKLEEYAGLIWKYRGYMWT